MTEDIVKTEDKWERAARLEEARKAEMHEMTKVAFVEQRSERESILRLHEHMRAQAEQVAAMAAAETRLAADRQRELRSATDARTQANAESKFLVVGDATIRVSSVLAVVADGPGASKALLMYGVTVPLNVSREFASEAIRAVQE